MNQMGVIHGITKALRKKDAAALIKKIIKSSQLWRSNPQKIKDDITELKNFDKDKERER